MSTQTKPDESRPEAFQTPLDPLIHASADTIAGNRTEDAEGTPLGATDNENDNTFFKAYSNQLAYSVENLKDCEHEPIQYIGAIQNSGFLIICDRETLTIRAASENLFSEIERNPDEVFGSQLNEIIRVKGHDSITNDVLPELIRNNQLEMVFNKLNSGKHLISFTFGEELLYVDIETYSTQMIDQEYPVDPIKDLVHDLDRAEGLDSICQALAHQLKVITTFDRVMVYRFDGHWNGEVLGEAREPSLESFLNLRYPASDIPAMARKLYFDSKYRMIVDISATPVPIRTGIGFARSEINLKHSALRAVSPIHVKYLKNMGVRASFSVALKVGTKLWGLIACHHYSGALHVSKQIRSACELAARVGSGKIADFVSNRRTAVHNQTLELTHALLNKVATGHSPIEAFAAMGPRVLELTTSTSAYIKIGAQELVLGDHPSRELIDRLKSRLNDEESLVAWKSECLKEDLGLDACEPRAAGAFAIPFSMGFEDLIIWFRPEVIREVRWGGRPVKGEGGDLKTRLQPRASFQAWSQSVVERCRPWTDQDEECAQYLLFNFVQGIFNKATVLSQANRELEAISKAKDEFIGQVSHELRTPLGVIIGWLDILRDIKGMTPEALEPLEVIERNARLQVNLINDLLDMSRIITGKLRIDLTPGVNINDIIKDVVGSLRPTAAAKSIELRSHFSAPVVVTADSERLRQIIWNLVINAIKFTPKGGFIDVKLEIDDSSYCVIVKDSGIGLEEKHLTSIFERFNQASEESVRKSGLGLGLSIVKALTELHGGQVRAKSEGIGKGAEFIVTLPVFALKAEEPVSDAADYKRAPLSRAFEGLRVLVAEDQSDAAKALAYLVRRNGGDVTIAENGSEAFKRLQKEPFDLILSDIGMPEMDGYELISKWRALERERRINRIPAVALTAYASSKDRTMALSRGFDSHIPKPVDREELIAVITSLKPPTAGVQ